MDRLKRFLSFLLLVTILTAAVDTIMFLSDYIPILNRMETSPFDWDIQDIVYSSERFKETTHKEPRVTLINFEHLDRDSIALVIEKIKVDSPAVVGINAVFAAKKDSIKDEKLRRALTRVNTVMSMDLVQWDEEMEKIVRYRGSHDSFIANQASYAFTDLNTYDPVRDIYRLQDDKLMRAYTPFVKFKNDTVYSFALELVKRYDRSIFNKYIEKFELTDHEQLRYFGDSSLFNVRSYKDILFDRYDLSEIRDRIVILTYLGYKTDDTRNSEDKHFTPLNSRIIARNQPDTFGGIIHANIAMSVLDGVKVRNTPLLGMVLVNVLIVFLFVLSLDKMRARYRERFSLFGRLTAYSFVLVLIGLSLFLYFRMDVRIDFRMAIVYIIALPEIYLLYVDKILPFLTRMITKFKQIKNKKMGDSPNEII